MELIRIENLFKTYFLGEVDVPVLKGVSVTIQQGEMVALMGVSGSGKSTLMNILGLLDRPTSGSYWLNGQEVSRLSADRRAKVRNRNIGFVFQSFNLLPRSTAVEQVRMPLVYAAKPWSNRDERRRAVELLERVGLGQRFDHEPSQLSGGQQQRVAISRALVNHPPILLADEPTGNLDSRTSEEILQMFQRLNKEEGISVILVTHDLNVARHANRIIYIRDGLIDNDALARLMAGAAGGNGQPPANGDGGGNGVAAGNGVASGNGYAYGSGMGADDGHASAVRSAENGGGNVATATVPATRVEVASMVEEAKLVGQPVAKRPGPPTHGVAVRLLPRTFGIAFTAIKRNAFRSVLTTLGIIIGIAAVIAMMEIGQGTTKMQQQTIASMGANILLIMPGTASTGGVSYGSGSTITLTPQDGDAIAQECPAVSSEAPVVRAKTQVVYGNKNWVPMYIYGSTPAFLDIRDWHDLTEGAPFTDRDVRDEEAVCLLGQTVVTNLFGDESPVGKDIRMQGVAFRVVGVLSRKGANMLGMDQDDLVLAPWTTIKFRVSSIGATVANQAASTTSSSSGSTSTTSSSISNTASQAYPNMGPDPNLYPSFAATETADTPQPVRFVNVDQLMVQADSTEDIALATDQVTNLLHDRHHIGSADSDDFNVRDMTEINNAFSSVTKLMSMLLLIVAAISLAVGGVGIMNIMLVSVTERTREIGLRMAVGARPRDILTQFLSEAVMLCIFGGAVGILLGRGISIAVRQLMHWPTALSVPAIIAAVVVSVSVGVVFGFYPAWKASRLDPIDALRYE
jgi:ABC-type lipoprotein export system ATPase subunit/ABC-type antimicrobial peptide transport system permease subunit